MALEAKEYLFKKLLLSKTITIGWMEWDKYGGRILADVYFDSVSVENIMLNSGYAIPYTGGKKIDNWCKTSFKLDQQN